MDTAFLVCSDSYARSKRNRHLSPKLPVNYRESKKEGTERGPIYDPSQWPPPIRVAREEGKPYKVKEMATEEFLNFKTLSKVFGQKFSKNSENEEVVWNDIQVMRIKKEYPNTVSYKTDFEATEYDNIN
ncbi:hypothetical protein ILUMI_14952 [Ignelater luminosus]|uniref:Uncharacterized protein n=1 Tax=Ignelater luminosus TaxID=2038154 RepID=A0A8K0CU03_IGNLU|nr:hypothetical protein ILUMI_14952 [Ignelater luminosus]